MSTGVVVSVGALVVAAGLGLTYIGTYNGFQKKDQAIQASERRIASCYQKRADLISNQEAAVERIMNQEKDVVIGNAQARSATPKLPDNATPEQVSEFIKAQGNALTRLTAVMESTPKIMTTLNMARFQKDLKDQETQCYLLRDRYISTVQAYNTSLNTFPSSWVASNHGFVKKDQIKFDDEKSNEKSPRVFGTKKN